MRTIILTLSATLLGCTGAPCVVDAPLVVSVSSDGELANAPVRAIAISGDGCRVVYESWATNLVAGVVPDVTNVFLYDVRTATTTLVGSRAEPDVLRAETIHPRIDGDGRQVTFSSAASNVVANDGNAGTDAFVMDVDEGETRRISVHGNGDEITSQYAGAGANISSDGAWVSFHTNAVLPATGRKGFHMRRIDGSGLLSVEPEGAYDIFGVQLSGDGSLVVYDRTQTQDAPARPGVLDVAAGTHREVVPETTWPGRRLSVLDIDDAGTRLLLMVSSAPPDPESVTLAVVDIRTGDVLWEPGDTLQAFYATSFGSGYAASLSPDGTTVAFGAQGYGLADDADDAHADVYVVDIASGFARRIGDPTGAFPRDGDTVGGAIGGRVVAVKTWSSHLIGAELPTQNGYPPAQAVLLPLP